MSRTTSGLPGRGRTGDGLAVARSGSGAAPGSARDDSTQASAPARTTGLGTDPEQVIDEGEGLHREANPATAAPAVDAAGHAVSGAVPGGDVPAAWTPPTALPAPAVGSRHVNVVLSPHPDDETLSLGVWTADALLRGDRVILVALTDGRGTGALPALETRLGHALTRDQIGTARIAELRSAATALGIAPSDVYLAHLDAATSTGETRLTVAEAGAVIRAFAARFPGATFATMSWTAERHPDHRAAGYALWQAQTAGTVHSSVFAVSRLWWSLPSPLAQAVHPTSAEARRRVIAAAAAYGLWDPQHQRYAVGWTSVHSQFVALLGDLRDRIHPWAAPATPFAPTAGFTVKVRKARPASGASPRHPF
jgi:LmbE family N-acetylglucosaminyl deacetylase